MEDAAKDGYGIAKESTGELKEAQDWHAIMQKAFDNAFAPPSSGLEEENLYYYSVYQFAQTEVIYHGTNAGLSMVEIENGVLKPPSSWLIKVTNQLLTSGIRAEAQSNIDTMRQNMNVARDVYVQRLVAVYGANQ